MGMDAVAKTERAELSRHSAHGAIRAIEHEHASLGLVSKTCPYSPAALTEQGEEAIVALAIWEVGMSERIRAIVGSIVFLFVAPGIVAGVLPWWISGYRMEPALLGFEPFRWLGVLLLALGGVLLIETFARFALQGLGTPAPIAPTKTLVVTGSYRFVRNPMYVAVISLILGQALLFGSVWTLIYGLFGWLIVHLFVLGYEEPTLSHSYGEQYDRYRANVRRWIPRLTPWQGA